MSDLAKLRIGQLRLIGIQRKRKLRKRGEYVFWSVELNSWAWEPGESFFRVISIKQLKSNIGKLSASDKASTVGALGR